MRNHNEKSWISMAKDEQEDKSDAEEKTEEEEE